MPLKPAHETSTSLLADRRRPGRPVDVHPSLIPLLRGTAEASSDLAAVPEDESDPLAVARGSMWATVLSAVFWLVVGVLCFLFGP